jgi:alkylation response protein AidB-like acyl-CoA dehydrogenase
MLFVMNELAGLAEVVAYPSYAEAGADIDLAPAVLEESAKFNQDVVAPLNWPSDQTPSSLKDGVVSTSPGFKDAFAQFAAAGWQGVIHPAEFGGQGGRHFFGGQSSETASNGGGTNDSGQ